VVSRPSAVRRKPKAPDEAPTYKKVMVALKPGFFISGWIFFIEDGLILTLIPGICRI